jgi:DNA-binding SARP family transcriptional activator
MPLLRISLLGQFEVYGAVRGTLIKVPRALQALLAYLLLQRDHGCPRDLVAGLFWGDHAEDRARHCLNSALWRLRRLLEPETGDRGTFLIATSTGEISFNWQSNHWFDVAALEEKAGRILARPFQALEETEVKTLRETLELYKGDLLEGFYEDWALREREGLRRLFLNSLARLLHYYMEQSAYQDALACGERILAHDPLREEIYRDMMRLHWMNGNRALAVRQYERCREVLAAELSICPMEETEALINRILSTGSGGRERPPPADEQRMGRRMALEQLRLAMKGLDQAREQLRRAVHLFEQVSEQHVEGAPLDR